MIYDCIVDKEEEIEVTVYTMGENHFLLTMSAVLLK